MNLEGKFETLIGEGNPHSIEVRDDSGVEGSKAHVIVPIMRRSNLDRADEKIIGTAFFITQNILVTAAHVLDDLIDAQGRQLGAAYIIQAGLDGKTYIRHINTGCLHSVADICIAQVEPAGLKNPALPLRAGFPDIGEQVFTYAYPHSKIEHENEDTRHVFLNEKPFLGSVIEVFPEGRDRVMMPWPCFRADFHMHGGASGGPVFDSRGRVIGVNSKSYDGQTDLSYVTPIFLVEDLTVSDVKYMGTIRDEIEIAELFSTDILKYF